jgi:chemotaxis protein histidine kinase CheA
MHSLKGTARYLEFKTVEALSHQVEDIIARVRDDEAVPDDGMISRLNGLVAELFKEIESINSLNDTFKSFSFTAEAAPLPSFLHTLEKMTADIAGDMEKNIRLEIHNSLDDFPFLSQLKNPVIHLVRNAIDHGIEDNFERLSRNKPEEGVITIRFDRDPAAAFYIIEVSDDGQGIDFEHIRNVAVEKGLIGDDVGPEDHSRLLKLLFSPRFSSKQSVSEISGRGVGLDVVKDALDEVKGKISVATRKLQGTKITLRIPVTNGNEGRV